MPMGVACAPSMFQSIMAETLRRLDALVYTDDILVIPRETESTEEHLEKVEEVLKCLEEAGFKANLRKSFFMQKRVEYLGYQFTCGGIGPQPKKIEVMDRILLPQTGKQLWRFLGMINFYKDLFRGRSHILSPLNELASASTKKKNGMKHPIPFVMLKKHLVTFDMAKEMIKTEFMLAFPDFNESFHLYTDASDIQVGTTLV